MAPPTKKSWTGHNISGLHNQNPLHQVEDSSWSCLWERNHDFFWQHACWLRAETAEDLEPEDILNDKDYSDEEFTKELMAMVEKQDAKDGDWLSTTVQKEIKKCGE